MIEDLSAATGVVDRRSDVAVIGTGPAGTVVALELARRGIDVIVVESGTLQPDSRVQELVSAAEYDKNVHADLRITQQRVLGGTSRIWGGRCLPFAPLDLARRDYLHVEGWPVRFEEISRYFDRACAWMDCGRSVFAARDIPGMAPTFLPGVDDDGVMTSELERWSLPIDYGVAYRDEYQSSTRVRVFLGVTCLEIETTRETRSAARLICRNFAGATIRVAARQFVIAAGGVDGTRVLLNSSSPHGGVLGDQSGHLGHWYMAHTNGVAADIHLNDPPERAFDFVKDVDGSYVRRRFTFSESYQRDNDLPNIVAWIDNPEVADASHHCGELSLVYLALSSPLGPRIAADAMRLSITGTYIPGTPYGGATVSPKRQHVANIARHPLRTGRFALGFGSRRLLAKSRKEPGYMVHNPKNIYPLEYHGEHLPQFNSRVWLTDDRDALGMPRLGLDLKFSDEDLEGVVRAHEHWDKYLRATGIGRLTYLEPDPRSSIRRRLGGGFHQTGTTRMSGDPSAGVVNSDLKLWDVDNVYVASGSTFPTSSHANPTFMVVAFASRLADHLVSVLGRVSSTG